MGLVVLVFLGGAVARGAQAPPVRVSESVSQRTRLVHGPVLFRILPRSTVYGEARYEVFFKLNRDPFTQQSREDENGRGNFSVFHGGDANAQDPEDVATINSKGDHNACIDVKYAAGEVAPFFLKRLDRVRLGSHAVRVFLRPFTQPATGLEELGTTYVASPRMQTSDLFHRSRNARRALARIGCSRWVGHEL